MTIEASLAATDEAPTYPEWANGDPDSLLTYIGEHQPIVLSLGEPAKAAVIMSKFSEHINGHHKAIDTLIYSESGRIMARISLHASDILPPQPA